MRFRFVVDGPKYSKHKAGFKKLLAEHRLAWRGGREDFVWASGRERVVGTYERDPVRDVTLKATLTWEGKAKTPFLNALKTWAFSLGAKAEEEKAARPKGSAAKERGARVEKELAFWDRVNKPDVAALRAAGRPQEWIDRDVEAWKKARQAKKREIQQALGQ